MHSSECSICAIEVNHSADFVLLNRYVVDFQLRLLLPGLRTSEFSLPNLNVFAESPGNVEDIKTNDFCEDCLVSVSRIAGIYTQVHTLLNELEQLKSKVKTNIQGAHRPPDDTYNIQSGCNEEHRDTGPYRTVRIRRVICDALGLLDAVKAEPNDDFITEPNDDFITESSDDSITESNDDLITESNDAIITESTGAVNKEPDNAVNTESNDAVNIESDHAVIIESDHAVNAKSNDPVNTESADAVNTDSTDAVNRESADAVSTESTDAVNTESNDVVNTESNDAVNAESKDAVNTESNDTINTESDDAVSTELIDASNSVEALYIEHDESFTIGGESEHDGTVTIELSTYEPECIFADLKKQFGLKDCCVRLERLQPVEVLAASLKRRKKRKYSKRNSSASTATPVQPKDKDPEKPSKPQRKRLHCDIPGCASYRLTEEELQRHKLREHSKELDPSMLPADNIYRYRCDFPQCKDIAYTEAGLRNHRSVVHNFRLKTSEIGEEDDSESLKTLRLYCDQPNCLKFFVTFRTFNEHKRTVHGLEVEDDVPVSAKEEKRLKCDVPGCKKSSFSQARLLAHKKKVHEDISQPFFCDKCGQVFTTSGGYRMHLKAVHGKTKDSVCHICGKAFTVQHYLNLHLETHNAPKYKCRFCPRAFKNPSGRTCHERSTHTGERPYVCDRCGKGFITNVKLRNHVNAIHNKDVRPFVCPLCGKDFPIRRYLQMHYVNSHKGHRVPRSEECRIDLDSVPTHTNEPTTMANDSACPN